MLIDISSINKLFVFGCSFSDKIGHKHSYGEYISNQLNIDYIHEAAGCGSNNRIFRKFFNHVRHGTLNENTLVIIQWTELFRDEIWYYKKNPQDLIGYSNGVPLVESDFNGYLYKFKTESYEWYDEDIIKKIMFDKESNCYSVEYELEKFKNIEFSILNYCKLNKIPTVLMNGIYNQFNIYNKNNEFIVIDYSDELQKYPRIMNDGSADNFHLSQTGMYKLGNKVINELKNKVTIT